MTDTGNLLKIEHYGRDVCVVFTAVADPANTVEVRCPAVFEAGLAARLHTLADQLSSRRPKETIAGETTVLRLRGS